MPVTPSEPMMIGPEAPSPFMRHIGYRMAEWSAGRAVITLDIRPDHLNRSGLVHGGIYSILIDTACGFAATYCAVPGRVRRVVSLSLTTTFTGQATQGALRTVAQLKGGGNRIVACAAEVFDGQGNLLAIGEGVYRYGSGSEKPEGLALDEPSRT
jgi:uncharacterized protein (TIGR00369 family)